MTNSGILRSIQTAASAFVVAVLVGACSASAPPKAPEEGPVEREWKELALGLPAYPQESDLLLLQLSRAVPARILIDGKSISSGDDGVVRYTVAIEGAGGVRNFFYEGIRCDTREYRRYAYGTIERKFAPLPNSRWEKIYNHGIEAFRFEGRLRYFCQIAGRSLGTIPKPAEIVEAIRNPPPQND